MNQVLGARYGFAPGMQIMGGTKISGPSGSNLNDVGRSYVDSTGIVDQLTPYPYQGGTLSPGAIPPLAPVPPKQKPTQIAPIFDYPPAASPPIGGQPIPARNTISPSFAPRFRQVVNVYVPGAGPTPAPSGTTPTSPSENPVTTLNDAGTSSPLQVSDTAVAEDNVPRQYVWAVGYVPAWQAAELMKDPAKLEKAQKAVKRHRLRNFAAGAVALMLGYFVARAAR